MDYSQITQELDKMALDVSLLDFSDQEDIDTLMNQITSLSDIFAECHITNFQEIFNCLKKNLQSCDDDKEAKEKIITYFFEFIRNFLKNSHSDQSDFDVNLFQSELKSLLQGEQNVESTLNRLESNAELLGEFVQNTQLLLAEIEEALITLEKDPSQTEHLNSAFRAFHTLKSEANSLSLINFGSLAHNTESLLEQVRSDTSQMDSNLITLLLQVVDQLRNYTELLKTDIKQALEWEFSDLVSALEQTKISSGGDKEQDDKTSFESTGSKQDQASTDTSKKDSEPGPVVEYADFKPCIPELDLSDGPDMITEFIAEAREHLDNSEEAVLTLESDPQDMDAVNLIFRAFHTVKGVTSFFGFDDIKTLAHVSETMLDLVRKGELNFDEQIANTTLTSIDNLRNLIALLEEQALNQGVLQSEYLDVTPQIKALQEIISLQRPPKPQVTKPLGEILTEDGSITQDELDQALELQNGQQEHLKVGEVLQNTHAASKKQVSNALNVQAGKVDSSIKISVNKLDNLVNLVGELVITETQVIQNNSLLNVEDNRLTKDLSELDRITRSLQESAMSMRLIPIRSTFQKMVRIIRDLSKKAGKDIDVKFIGEETEIDKNMVEMVSDPLVHMVRNAADHGIEKPDARQAKGKPPKGTITLSAYHKGGSVVIEIKDDGGGLNRDKILAKAIDRGIIKSKDDVPENRIWNLVFEPGFSTAEKVTEVSGRGVGMDVVKKNIEQLRGRIDITSELDKGSCFAIYLPITLAIIEGIVLKVGKERFILPIHSIIEFVCPDAKRKNDVVSQGEMYRFHDDIHPLVHFDQLFGIESQYENLEEKTICVCESDFGRYCFVVDDVLGQQQVVIKSLGNRLKNIKGLSGGAILGDGRVGLILDVNGIVEFVRKTYLC
jgi:two-component system chemotaxis sensor kinase CheA